MNMRRGLLAAFIALPLVAAADAQPNRQDPVADPEERAEELAYGEQVFDNSCRMCHEPELVRQQRLTPRQWDAEIEKMIGWGAALAAEEVPYLRQYLTTNFGPSNAHQSSTLNTVLEKPASVVTSVDPRTRGDGSVERGQALYVEHCGTCHGANGQGGEPGQNLVAQPMLTEVENFRAVLAQGRHKMPAFNEVLTTDQVEDVRTWLLTLQFDPR